MTASVATIAVWIFLFNGNDVVNTTNDSAWGGDGNDTLIGIMYTPWSWYSGNEYLDGGEDEVFAGGNQGQTAPDAYAQTEETRQRMADQVLRRDRDDSAVTSFLEPSDGVRLLDTSDLDFEAVVAAVVAAVEAARTSGVDRRDAPLADTGE